MKICRRSLEDIRKPLAISPFLCYHQNRKGLILMKHLKLKTGFLLTLAAGFLIGMLTAFGQCASLYRTEGYLMTCFGHVVMGLLPWAVICTALSLWAKNPLHASLLVLSFMSAMLCGYSMFMLLEIGSVSGPVFLLWIFLLLPAAAAGWAVHCVRRSQVLRGVFMAGAVGVFLFDLAVASEGELPAVGFEFALLILLLYCLAAAGKQQKPGAFGRILHMLGTNWDDPDAPSPMHADIFR